MITEINIRELYNSVNFSYVKRALSSSSNNISIMLSHVSNGSGDEAAIISVLNRYFDSWQRKCTKNEIGFDIIWLSVLNRIEPKKNKK